MLVKKLNGLRSRSSEEGFTLIELMIVVVIIGILAAIAIPIFANQQTESVKATAKSDLKNATTVMATEAAKLGGKYPGTLPASVKTSKGNVITLAGTPAGPRVNNPALSVTRPFKDMSWNTFEDTYGVNTGESKIAMRFGSGNLYDNYYFYPRTGSSYSQFDTVLDTICPLAPNAYICTQPDSYREGQWNQAKASGAMINVSHELVAGNNNDTISVSVDGSAGSYYQTLIGNNDYLYYKPYNNGANKVPAWNAVSRPEAPSLADTDPATWGTPSSGSTDPSLKYCLNVTNTDIDSIKLHFDSSVGKIQEGLCS